jgi:MYXO-CTERM domain-containing protein
MRWALALALFVALTGAASNAHALSSIDCNEYGGTGYDKGNPFPITLVTVDGKPVEKSTANAYYVMAQAAAAAGVMLKINSGFRTMAEQEYFYNCHITCSCNNCNLAAEPGHSNHQSGHALDLNTASPGVYGWLEAHAGSFGFKRTVSSEPWHWEWWEGGPGGGPCDCKPTGCNGSNIVSSCGQGDCAAYGATCVHDELGPRCASVFCPATGQTKVCIDGAIIGDCNNGAISTGDCSAYGAACVDDELGARCVSPLCPAKGEATVCVDDAKILDCKDGAHAGGGDCSAYGAYCSSAGAEDARCVSVFCVASAEEVPFAKDVCLPNGQLAHCASDGAITVEDCPAAEPCDQSEYGAACGLAPAGPPPGGGGSGGSGGAQGNDPSEPGDSGEALGDESGCACRAGGSGAPSGAGWAAILALGFALGRRWAGGTGRA